jgi:hypothetical protein
MRQNIKSSKARGEEGGGGSINNIALNFFVVEVLFILGGLEA